MEIWKDINNHKGYQISNMGNVRSFKSKGPNKLLKDNYHLLKTHISNHGYVRVALRDGKKLSISLYIHRLIAEHFIDNPLKLSHVNHINGIRHDYRIENLEWVTCKDNVLHGRHVLGKVIGNNHHNSKLNDDKVRLIRKLISDGKNDTEIGLSFGVHRRTISDVRLLKTWVGVI